MPTRAVQPLKKCILLKFELYDMIIVIKIFFFLFRFLQPCLCQNVLVCLRGWEERLLKIVQVQCHVCDSGNNRNFMAVVTVPRQ
jgi:hypothetical protein